VKQKRCAELDISPYNPILRHIKLPAYDHSELASLYKRR